MGALVPELGLSPTSPGCATTALCPPGPKPPLRCYSRTLVTAAFPPTCRSHSGELLRPRYQLHGIRADTHTLDISATATESTPLRQAPGTLVSSEDASSSAALGALGASMSDQVPKRDSLATISFHGQKIPLSLSADFLAENLQAKRE